MPSALELRRRRVARLALYGSLALVGLLTALALRQLARPMAAGLEMRWAERDFARQPAVRLLQQYLRIDTTAASGDLLAAALFLATPLEAAGLAPVVEPVGGAANLWADLPGRERAALVLLNHLDVEPVDRADPWRHPPFSGALDPPFLVSRGVFDMKSYAVAQLFALLDLARRPERGRTVRFVATADEEAGSDLGMKWLLRERPELFEGAWGVLNEGGMVEATELETPRYWAIETGQKRFVEVLFCSADRERLETLYRDLREHGRSSTGLAVPDEVREVWRVYAPTRGRGELRDLLADPDRFLTDPAAFERLPPYLQSMLRSEAVPFGVTPAPGGGWQLRVLLHLLPGVELAAVRDRLLPEWAVAGLPMTVVEPPVTLSSPLGHSLYRQLAGVLQRRHPTAMIGPYLLPWTRTDSRHLRARGIPSYGFSPFLVLTTDNLATGSPNERLSLPGFVAGVALYEDVVTSLADDE